MLAQFSLKSGRRLGTIASVPVPAGSQVSLPRAQRGGSLVLTFSSGPKCKLPPGVTVSFGPCFPEPNSCSSRTERVDPYTGMYSPLLTQPASTLVTDAIPSADGRMIVMRTGGCATSFFDMHLVVRNLRTGRQWSLGADAVRCHEITSPSWSADGRRLVFAYGPSILPAGTKPSAQTSCQAPRFNRLVITRADRASAARSWRLLAADPGCSYQAAAFDARGIVAVEACKHGAPRGSGSDPQLGQAYLLQLDQRDRIVARRALELGWEQGVLSTERDGKVLISQDQPANAGYPERDWVWELDGQHLRLIASYRANDAAQVIAMPW